MNLFTSTIYKSQRNLVITSLYLGSRRLGSSLIFLPLDIRSLDISLCQVMVGRLPETTFRVKSLGCPVGGRPQDWVVVNLSLGMLGPHPSSSKT